MINVANDTSRELEEILSEYLQLPEYSGMKSINLASKSLFGSYPINIAAARGLRNEILALIDNGADVNSRGEHGYTPLHDSVEQGHENIVKILLEFGADEYVENNDGLTPKKLTQLLEGSGILSCFKG